MGNCKSQSQTATVQTATVQTATVQTAKVQIATVQTATVQTATVQIATVLPDVIPMIRIPYIMLNEPMGETFKIRGKTYKDDKIKCNSDSSKFNFIGARTYVGYANNIVSKEFKNNNIDTDDFVFCINIIVPNGGPSIILYFNGNRTKLISNVEKKFFSDDCDDEFRNNTFKLIPRVTDGNMINKMCVNGNPILICNKLKTKYYSSNKYCWTCIRIR
jgi:hypothetical protein